MPLDALAMDDVELWDQWRWIPEGVFSYSARLRKGCMLPKPLPWAAPDPGSSLSPLHCDGNSPVNSRLSLLHGGKRRLVAYSVEGGPRAPGHLRVQAVLCGAVNRGGKVCFTCFQPRNDDVEMAYSCLGRDCKAKGRAAEG